jgi:TolA-binding protein
LARNNSQNFQFKSSSSTAPSGMAFTLPDFDEDPETVIRRYKDQLERLNSRIELLQEESNTIENVRKRQQNKNLTLGILFKVNQIGDDPQDCK